MHRSAITVLTLAVTGKPLVRGRSPRRHYCRISFAADAKPWCTRSSRKRAGIDTYLFDAFNSQPKVDGIRDETMGGRMLVGAGAGFSGDRVDAPIAVVRGLRAGGERAAIIFETLGERTLALAQLRRRENPAVGYEPKLAALLSPVLKDCLDGNITIVGNFGAANPPAAADLVAKLAERSGRNARIATLTGDDMLDPAGLEILRACCDELPDEKLLVSANVYLGAAPIVEALNEGAQVVVTGRVADPSLTLAPLIHAFGWSYDDWQRLGRGTMAGHLLECGAQVTGGYFADPGFKDVPAPENIGYPIARIDSDGGFAIGKAAGGGLVDRHTVTEQLLYEVHDPAAYLTPGRDGRHQRRQPHRIRRRLGAREWRHRPRAA